MRGANIFLLPFSIYEVGHFDKSLLLKVRIRFLFLLEAHRQEGNSGGSSHDSSFVASLEADSCIDCLRDNNH